MLNWFVGKFALDSALKGNLLQEKDIKSLKNMSSSCLDDNVDLYRLKKYFTPEAWNTLLRRVQEKLKCEWLCSICYSTLDEEQIACDSCLSWCHFRCVGLSHSPKAKQWFCNTCYNNL